MDGGRIAISAIFEKTFLGEFRENGGVFDVILRERAIFGLKTRLSAQINEGKRGYEGISLRVGARAGGGGGDSDVKTGWRGRAAQKGGGKRGGLAGRTYERSGGPLSCW